MAHFDADEPSSYLLDPAVNLVPRQGPEQPIGPQPAIIASRPAHQRSPGAIVVYRAGGLHDVFATAC
jgi:hypothetical protein